MLNLSNFAFTTCILYIFVGITNAGLLEDTPGLIEDTKEFRLDQIQLTDKLRKKALEQTLAVLNETVNQSLSAGVDLNTVNICVEGFKNALNLLKSCRINLNAALIAAQKLTDKNPETAIDTVRKATNGIADNIFLQGVPIQTMYGSVLSIVGESSRPGLRNALKLIQQCASILFDSLQNGERMATVGIKAGGSASDQALIAVKEMFNTAEEAIYKLLIEGAISVFEGLKAAAGKAPVRGFTANSSDTGIANEVSGAQIIMETLSAGFKEASNTITKKSSIEALNTIHQNFVSSVLENARAIKKLLNAIDEVENQLGSNPEVIVAALQKALTDAKDDILVGSVDIILGLGSAGYTSGKKLEDQLTPAIVSILQGWRYLYMDLELAEEVAITGLRGRDRAAEQGLLTGRACISAGSKALFTRFVDAAQIIFKILKAF